MGGRGATSTPHEYYTHFSIVKASIILMGGSRCNSYPPWVLYSLFNRESEYNTHGGSRCNFYPPWVLYSLFNRESEYNTHGGVEVHPGVSGSFGGFGGGSGDVLGAKNKNYCYVSLYVLRRRVIYNYRHQIWLRILVFSRAYVSLSRLERWVPDLDRVIFFYFFYRLAYP